MVFHSRLSDSKSLQLCRTLLSIQADRNYALVLLVSTHSSISNSSSPLTKTVDHSKCPIDSITITFIFCWLFSSLTKFKYWSHFLLSLIFILWSIGTVKSTTQQDLFFFVILGFIIIIFDFTHLRVFHTSVSWWFPQSPGLSLVFWPILTIL